MKIAESDLERMGAGLGEIRDPRRPGGKIRYNLVERKLRGLASWISRLKIM
ncbi:MAG: hypothetical protein LBG76_02420 [Treponema sp.]|jgi:hypothetical protein|nr:hypothetical protein [Treponema sp.]